MRERDIFITALEKTSDAARAAFLDEACGRGGALRDRVEDLLREHARLGGFLESPTPDIPRADTGGGATSPQTTTDVAGSKILGDFRIIREVGRGGMGTVYEVEQISLGRHMALKVLPFSSVLDPRHLQRFENEARAAASLRHPHIVSVHSVGCERGVHYYAMEFVEGKTLAQWIADRGVVREPRDAAEAAREPASTCETARPVENGLTDREDKPTPVTGEATRRIAAAVATESTGRSPEFFCTAAKLGIQAAEALDHAHQMGIIHRDIKPSNLLVDVRGNLLITDFGLAVTQHDPALTHTGDVVGTLRYMSPEQIRGNRAVVDGRTDVYSLGITLYELLTSRPAFAGDNREVILRQIAEDDPPAPRKLNAAIPRDLETIVLKAIDKEPARRYLTAQQMADDLHRFLDNEPILARRPSVVEYVAKWTRRHRALAATVMISCLVVLAISLISSLLVYRAYEREKAERTLAEENAVAARRNYEIAREAIRRMLARVGDEDLGDDPKMAAVRQHLLKDAAAFCADVIQRSPQDPGADIHELLASRYLELNEYENAVAEATKCIALVGGTDSEAADPRNFDKYSIRAEAYAGLKMYRESLSDWNRVMELVSDRPWYYKRRALVHFQLQQYEQALADLTKAVNLTPSDWSNVTWIPPEMVADCPDKHFRQGVLELAERVSRANPPTPDAAFQRNNFLRVVDPQLAREELDRTIQREPGSVSAWIERARFATWQERWADAIADYEQALELQPDDARVCNGLAWLLCTAGDRSVWNAERAVELAKKAVSLVPNSNSHWNTLGVAQYRAGDYQAAVESLNKALDIGSRYASTDYIAMALVQWKRGNNEDALRWYHMSDATPHSISFLPLRREANDLLGITDQYTATPKPPEENKK